MPVVLFINLILNYKQGSYKVHFTCKRLGLYNHWIRSTGEYWPFDIHITWNKKKKKKNL